MEFSLAKRRFSIEPSDISQKLEAINPEVINIYAVRIKNKLYPCKQVISIITGLPKASFNAHQAYQILDRIGLNVVVIKEAKDKNIETRNKKQKRKE